MRYLLILIVFIASAVRAEPPRVLVDTAPLHSLVSLVMRGVEIPDLLLPPGASPHDYALRPSDARALAQADLIFWVGASFTPWLAEPIATLAPETNAVSALKFYGWEPLALRYTADFSAEVAADNSADLSIDPHAWLNPEVAIVWLYAIAEELSAFDPQNADLYRRNAQSSERDILQLQQDVQHLLEGQRTIGYLVPHDAFQYFERAFGIPAFGAISLSDDTPPGPTHLLLLREAIAEQKITCILSEPMMNSARLASLTEGHNIRVIDIDPDGINLTPGPDLYGQLILSIGQSITECFAGN